MKDTAKIKKYNSDLIRASLRTMEKATKQDVSLSTSLSLSTCNTILNELEYSGEVFSEKIQVNDVGRSSKQYYLNKDFTCLLCMHFKVSNGKKVLFHALLNLFGEVVTEMTETLPRIDYTVLDAKVGSYVSKYPNISHISIGIPGIPDKDLIRFCDVDELTGVRLAGKLRDTYGIPVTMETDMHVMTYGYYKNMCEENSTVSFAIFPRNILPGTGTIIDGKVIKGATSFAGQVGFLSYGMSQEEQKARLTRENFLPLARQAVTALIAIMNPHLIVLTGDLADESLPEKLAQICREDIPPEHMPEMLYVQDIDHYFLEGLYSLAVEFGKEF